MPDVLPLPASWEVSPLSTAAPVPEKAAVVEGGRATHKTQTTQLQTRTKEKYLTH